MARSMAAAILGSIVTFRGVIRIASSLTRSNRSTCSRTYASPRARTPAMARSATRSASSFDAARRSSIARRAASASGELAFNPGCLLDSRDELADPFWLRAIDVLADDQAGRNLSDRVEKLQFVDAHGLPGLDEVDYMRSQIQDGRELDGAAQRYDLGADALSIEVLAGDTRGISRHLRCQGATEPRPAPDPPLAKGGRGID